MLTRFLLGPSGTGKTFRCLAEIRAALAADPQGAPLVLLAPKQATFQLERQLLAGGGCDGYSRLQILSFERLAEFILNEWGDGAPGLLGGQGRLMVLRALVERCRPDLELFHATARLRGFAEQLSAALREMQRAGLTPEDIARLSERAGDDPRLAAKLRDLGLLLGAYVCWMESHGLQDEDRLLTLAAAAVRSLDAPSGEAGAGWLRARIDGLWLDGFSELAPQELDLLAVLLPHCERATLALNVEREAIGDTSWLAPWSLVTQTYKKLRARLEGDRRIDVAVEWLGRGADTGRFQGAPALQHLERHWSRSQPSPWGEADGTVRLAVCADRPAEVLRAAREIHAFVRAGGRYRDVAVIVRDLESYHVPVRRVFTSHGIPFFIDRREPAGHHPVAELTRSALRTVVFDWAHEDWFGALKTGLAGVSDEDVDHLENEALSRGWIGGDWTGVPRFGEDEAELRAWFEPLQARLTGPFVRLASDLGKAPGGRVLARALKSLWDELQVGEQLGRWSELPGGAWHTTVWELMLDWVESIELAFDSESIPLRGWLPIVETGLAALAVGVVPPALDQVLVGAVDRSRNPELRLAIVLGLNESVFPGIVPSAGMVTDSDRARLSELGVALGHTARERLAREHYLGYVACTRSRERLLATCALRDDRDAALNPSVFMERLRALFPAAGMEAGIGPVSWDTCLHEAELVGQILPARLRRPEGGAIPDDLLAIEAVRRFLERLRESGAEGQPGALAPGEATRLYGPSLRTSVSRLEEFAACPFRFFVATGLRARERERFEVDVREEGTFQHEVLARFHERLVRDGRRWRDLEPGEAGALVDEIAGDLAGSHQGGLFETKARSRFMARSLTQSLRAFVETTVRWMGQYEFDPRVVEFGFGQEEDPLPPWRIPVDEGHELQLRGKIDRVDLCLPEPGAATAWCVVIDYKSSARRLEPALVASGLQLQLPAYLATLLALPEVPSLLKVSSLVPAGVFYVNLRGAWEGAATRDEAAVADGTDAREAYRHSGRFRDDALPFLDSRKGADRGDQFNYKRTKTGAIHGVCREVVPSSVFEDWLRSVEDRLRGMGREIFAGAVAIDPYTFAGMTACDRCDFRSICRIDPWTHCFRAIQGPARA